MNLLLNPALTEALGLTLLHALWQGALLAALLLIMQTLLRGSSAQARYLCACTALVFSLLLPLGTFSRLYTPPQASPALQTVAQTAPEVIAQPPLEPTPAPALTLPLPPANPLPAPQAAPAPPTPTPTWQPRLMPYLPLLVTFYLVGVALLSLRLLGQLLHAERFRRKHKRAAAPAWQARLEGLRERLKLRQRVLLLESHLLDAPTVIGYLKPVILLPTSALSGLTTEQLEAILAHELAHIKRHDYLVNLLQSVIETLLFYHPAVLWMSAQVRLEREHACDEVALSVCGNPLVYARALTELETLRHSPALALGAKGGSLMQRVKRIVGMPERVTPLKPLSGLIVLTLVLGGIFALPRGVAAMPESAGQHDEPFVWSEELSAGVRTWLTVSGDVRFNRSYTRVENFGESGYLLLEERQEGVTQAVHVSADAGGDPLYRYTVNGSPQPFDETARAWYEARVALMLEPMQTSRGSRYGMNSLMLTLNTWLDTVLPFRRDESISHGNLVFYDILDPEASVRSVVLMPERSVFFNRNLADVAPSLLSQALYGDMLQAQHILAHGLAPERTFQGFVENLLAQTEPDPTLLTYTLQAVNEVVDDAVKLELLQILVPYIRQEPQLREAYHLVAASLDNAAQQRALEALAPAEPPLPPTPSAEQPYLPSAIETSIWATIYGEVRFDSLYRTIDTLETDAAFVLEERNDQLVRRVQVSADTEDNLRYDYTLNGVAQPFDSAAQEWFDLNLASMLMPLREHTDSQAPFGGSVRRSNTLFRSLKVAPPTEQGYLDLFERSVFRHSNRSDAFAEPTTVLLQNLVLEATHILAHNLGSDQGFRNFIDDMLEHVEPDATLLRYTLQAVNEVLEDEVKLELLQNLASHIKGTDLRELYLTVATTLPEPLRQEAEGALEAMARPSSEMFAESEASHGVWVTVSGSDSITLSDYISSIQSMGAGASIVFEERSPTLARRLELSQEASKFVYRYSENGQEQPFNVAARAWYERVLQAGLLSYARDNLAPQGGRDLSRLPDRWGHRATPDGRFYTLSFVSDGRPESSPENVTISPEDRARILLDSSRLIEASYLDEKRRISKTAHAYHLAAHGHVSDAGIAAFALEFIDRYSQDLDERLLRTILLTLNEFGSDSDNDKHRVLLELAPYIQQEPELRALYLDIASTLSEPLQQEAEEALEAPTASPQMEGSFWATVIGDVRLNEQGNAIETISSDGYVLLEQRDAAGVRRVRIHSDNAGALLYTYGADDTPSAVLVDWVAPALELALFRPVRLRSHASHAPQAQQEGWLAGSYSWGQLAEGFLSMTVGTRATITENPYSSGLEEVRNNMRRMLHYAAHNVTPEISLRTSLLDSLAMTPLEPEDVALSLAIAAELARGDYQLEILRAVAPGVTDSTRAAYLAVAQGLTPAPFREALEALETPQALEGDASHPFTSSLWTSVYGDVRFDSGFTLIESMAADAYVLLEERGSVTRRVHITQGEAGLHYLYSLNGQTQPLDDEGRVWLEYTLKDAVLDLLRNAEQRGQPLAGAAQYSGGDRARSLIISNTNDLRLRPVSQLIQNNTNSMNAVRASLNNVTHIMAHELASENSFRSYFHDVIRHAELDNTLLVSLLYTVHEISDNPLKLELLQTLAPHLGQEPELRRRYLELAATLPEPFRQEAEGALE